MRRIGLLAAFLSLIQFSCALAQPQPEAVDQSQNTSRWPLQVNSPDGQITIFQPQMEDFQGETLKARAAVSIQQTGQQEPIFGAVWLDSRVATDRVARTVQILDINITQSRFPNTDDATQQKFSGEIKQALLDRPVTLSLDQLLEMLQTVQKEQSQAEDLQTAPPQIIFRDHPTIKVQYDGKPKLVQDGNSGLMRVDNTPFFVALDPQSKTYFLKGAGLWFAARDPIGPFQKVSQVPQTIAQLADADDYKDPQQPLNSAQSQSVEIITASDPAELIWTDGQPQMGTIEGTSLLYWTNTDSDVFLDINSQQLYVLLSGRWYSGHGQNGPWTFVAPDKLPPDFAKIPPNSDQGDVLAHVAGTAAANDAVADTEIPQTAAVDRKQFDQPDVQYDGDPQFDSVEGTPCSYATNTASAVVLVSGRYYCCDNASWYCSPSARGPWEVCTAVPRDIYTLPPSCPIYPVRYCYVYGYTPDVVYCGYLPGYVGCYRYHGCVVYGTGYHYRPWEGHAYYARPWTYGFAAHYNSYVGHWGFSFGLATGGGGVWIGEGPKAWGRREPWFGYGGYRPVVVHNDVHVDIFREQYRARTHDEHQRVEPERRDVYARNVYERRKDVRWEGGGGRPADNQRRDVDNRNDHRDVPQRDERQINAPHPAADDRKRDDNARNNNNDVFTDHQGNVYRRTDKGWEVRDKDNWKAAPAEQHDDRNAPRDEPKATDIHGALPAHKDEPAEQPHPAPDERREDHPVDVKQPAPAPRDEPKATDIHGALPQHKDEPAAQPHPAPAPANRDLDRDYKARVSADQRLHGYERSSDQKDQKSQKH